MCQIYHKGELQLNLLVVLTVISGEISILSFLQNILKATHVIICDERFLWKTFMTEFGFNKLQAYNL